MQDFVIAGSAVTRSVASSAARLVSRARSAQSSTGGPAQPPGGIGMSDASDTTLTAVRAAHRFDTAALGRYLAAHLPGSGALRRVRQYEGGQSNPTFRLDSEGGSLVLRKKPPGRLLPSAHQVEREYRILAALHGTGVPVPRPLLLCEDAAVIGTAFYIMEHVPGRVVEHPALPGLSPADRAAAYADMNRVLAALHAVDPGAVGLGDLGRPDGYLARQIRRWSDQYRRSAPRPLPAMERMMDWLPRHIPAREETTLIHGDFRPGNLILHPTEPRVAAVLDWELATLGHPLADLAHCALAWHFPPDAARLPGIDPDTRAAMGLPAEAEHVADYARRSGRSPGADWPFFLAFALFRMAAIVQGVHARALQGNAASEAARAYGPLVAIYADRALALAAEAGGA